MSEASARQIPPGAWRAAHDAAARLISPLQRVLAIEATSGLLLVGVAVIALVWANSPWASSYAYLWHIELGVRFDSWQFTRPLHFWVNDGLMTWFFFVVGLEIRREAYEGELAGLRRAALPAAAAIGGILVPAAIYAALNVGRAGAAGWAVPMATDIAFAIGVLTLLGPRVHPSLRMLLLALAVIDDVAAILVIAIFYTDGIALYGLGIAAAGVAGVLVMRMIGLRLPIAYLVPGLAVWIGLYRAGVHPTLAGVLLGLMTPVRPWFGRSGFAAATQAHLDAMPEAGDRDALFERLAGVERARREAVSPAERLIHVLHPWVAFAIMPLFALANAGVSLGAASLSGDGLYVFLGIVLGLVVGKPLGVVVATWIATRTGVATRPDEIDGHGIVLVGAVAGIGFTMSLFVAQLAFPAGPLLETAKLAILVGSAAAIVVGLGYGLLTTRRRD